MADLFNQLKERVDNLFSDLEEHLDRINPATETGEKPLVSQVEKLKEKVEIRSTDTTASLMSALNRQLAKYGVILKDDLDKIEERIDRIEAELREL